jgi:hypothetical protein
VGDPSASAATCIVSANLAATALTKGAATSSGTDGAGAAAYVGTGAGQVDSSGASSSATIKGWAFCASGTTASDASATRLTTWNALTASVTLVTGGTITSLASNALYEQFTQDNDLNVDS